MPTRHTLKNIALVTAFLAALCGCSTPPPSYVGDVCLTDSVRFTGMPALTLEPGKLELIESHGETSTHSYNKMRFVSARKLKDEHRPDHIEIQWGHMTNLCAVAESRRFCEPTPISALRPCSSL